MAIVIDVDVLDHHQSLTRGEWLNVDSSSAVSRDDAVAYVQVGARRPCWRKSYAVGAIRDRAIVDDHAERCALACEAGASPSADIQTLEQHSATDFGGNVDVTLNACPGAGADD